MKSEVIKVKKLIQLAIETRKNMSEVEGVSYAFTPSLHVNCDLLTLIRTCKIYKPDNVRLPEKHNYIYADYCVEEGIRQVSLSARID